MYIRINGHQMLQSLAQLSNCSPNVNHSNKLDNEDDKNDNLICFDEAVHVAMTLEAAYIRGSPVAG
ncbi:hypothetical protein Leryth_019977 [Lithospermum erythrorhizon]|nr:hypothetical protein Leryth_019977 [Lithospermum erythrorhizon]